MARATETELPIIRATYEYALVLLPQIEKFPREHRYVLGERMQRQLYGILENLIRARYLRSRQAVLEQVNLDLEILRFQVRLAKDLRCLSLGNYGTSARHINDIGRQVGGWLRQSAGPAK